MKHSRKLRIGFWRHWLMLMFRPWPWLRRLWSTGGNAHGGAS